MLTLVVLFAGVGLLWTALLIRSLEKQNKELVTDIGYVRNELGCTREEFRMLHRRVGEFDKFIHPAEDEKMMEKCETCGHEPRKIKNAFDLLQNITAGLNKHHMTRIADLEVIFYEDGEVVLATGVPNALDYLANDLWWNEESEWDGADRAEVRTM